MFPGFQVVRSQSCCFCKHKDSSALAYLSCFLIVPARCCTPLTARTWLIRCKIIHSLAFALHTRAKPQPTQPVDQQAQPGRIMPWGYGAHVGTKPCCAWLSWSVAAHGQYAAVRLTTSRLACHADLPPGCAPNDHTARLSIAGPKDCYECS